jgi:hypothetical protein
VCTQWRDLVDDEEVWEAQVQQIVEARPDPVLAPPPATPSAAAGSAATAGTETAAVTTSIATESVTAPTDDGYVTRSSPHARASRD